MGAGYVIAKENFKEAGKLVSADADPVMFNLLYGLLSLTNQIETEFNVLRETLAPVRPPRKRTAQRARTKKAKAKSNKKSIRR